MCMSHDNPFSVVQADKTKIKTLQKEIKSSSKSGPTASGGGGSIEDVSTSD